MTTVTPSASANQRVAGILARQDRINVWALPWFYLAIIGTGYFFTFYDISDIGFAMPQIQTQFHLTGNESTFLALAIGLIGYAAGSVAIGTLADRFGRFRMLILTITLTAIGSFGDAASNGVVALIIFRFITGMGVGADLNLVSTYVGELAPARLRGRISVLTFLVGIIGQAVTPFIALALIPGLHNGWRWLFIIGGIIAVIALVARFELPESPRWLALHGRLDEADELVRQMEERATRRGVRLPEPDASHVDTRSGFPYRDLVTPPYVGRVAVFLAFWFFWYIGNYGFLGDAADLFKHHGLSAGTLYLAIGAVGYPVGALIMAWAIDRYERKLLLLGSTVVWLAGMLIIGSAAGEALVIVGAFLASTALGMFLQAGYTYTAESFPTRARASGFALCDGLGHGGGALGALVLPSVVASASFFVGFAGIGVTGLIAGLIALLGPAASGMSLERVSA
ncbi:MAG TPA: MFS transporter [Solirubrobacteraceae bacterium]|nr:MFS transporter [Solirubrobacteraceae bacterium]